MKKTNYLKVLAMFFAVFGMITFTSCDDDDDDDKTNYFMLGEMEGVLDKGYLEYYGMWNETSGYNFDISLVSSDLSMDGETGIGDVAYFELFSESATELKSGIYTYNETYEAYTFDYGGFDINFNIETEESDEYGEMTAGTVEIAKSGEKYTIEFSGTASGKSVKGHYSGSLMYYDLSDDMKSGKTKKLWKK